MSVGDSRDTITRFVFKGKLFYEFKFTEAVWTTEMSMRLATLTFNVAFIGNQILEIFEWILIDFKTFWFYKSELPQGSQSINKLVF